MTRQIDMTGYQFGRLVVSEQTNLRAPCNRPLWLCFCECGGITVATRNTLTKGQVQSCGCLQREKCRESGKQSNYRHGMTNTPTWRSWKSMLERCYKPRTASYARYGGQGIKVCDHWHKFENFFADMGERPPKTTLDRYPDQTGNYCPGNCRWATAKEQSMNRAVIVVLELNGERKHINEWAKLMGIRPGTIFMRLYNGWTVERALTTKLRIIS